MDAGARAAQEQLPTGEVGDGDRVIQVATLDHAIAVATATKIGESEMTEGS